MTIQLDEDVRQLPLTLTPRPRLSEVVARQILEAISDLEPGSRVPPERELTRILGVSRTTLREALRGLAVLGAIDVRHGQGAFVRARPETGIDSELAAALAKGVTPDLVEARQVVAVDIARLAALRRTDEDLVALQKVIDMQRQALDAGRRTILEGLRFDLAVADAAHNEVLAGVMRSFQRLMLPRARAVYERIPDFGRVDLEMHEGICSAIRDGDGDAAAEAMRVHLSDLEQYYLAFAQA